VGYTARGLVILVISYLTFVAAFTANSNSAGGTKDAFQFVQNEFGTIVLAVIAAGLFTYGFFMFVKSRYRSINI
jgi:ABC-type Na+ efflux pump permease subunit